MNIHSFFHCVGQFIMRMSAHSKGNAMTEAAILIAIDESPKLSVRRDAILDAAQRVFSEKGFELATIQDVATACGMSAGNLYRYFVSKAAMVSGLIERDRNEMAASFAALALSPNQLESFESMGRDYLKDECTRDARLTLEIWAVSNRRPELRAVCESIEQAVRANLDRFMQRIVAEGALAPGVDPGLVPHLILVFVHALLRDAALKPDLNIDHDLDVMFATIRAALAGHIKFTRETTP
jgi:TetR/AcrR family transcriptional regulator, repressor for uid operon